MTTIKGIIFDMDGVIIDSVGFHFGIWREVTKDYGAELTDEMLSQLNGMDTPMIAEKIVATFALKADPSDLANRKWKLVRERVGQMPLFPGVRRTVQTLKRLGYRLALGTSSPKRMEELSLGPQFKELEFDAVVTDDDVTKAKPDPDIFLKCAEELGLKPEECIVVEDAVNGIKAAKNAKMKAVAITTTSREEYFREADAVIGSISELNSDLIKRIEGDV